MEGSNEEIITPLKKKSLLWLLGLLLAAGLVFGLLYNVRLSQLKSTLSSWSSLHLALAAVCALIAILMRGLRWGLILDQLGNRNYGLAMNMAHVGLMLNAIFPLRTGDLYKVFFVGRLGLLPYHKALIALIFERALDALVLYGFYIVSIFMLGETNKAHIDIYGAQVPKDYIANAFDSLALLIAGVFAFFYLLQLRVAKQILIAAYRLSRGFAHKGLRKLYVIHESFIEVVRQIRNPLSLALILILSLLPWILFAFSIYIVSLGFQGAQLDFTHAIFVASVALIAVQLPSIPGGWGLFEAGGVIAIVSYSSLNVPIAFSVVLMAHLCQYIPTILAGLFSQVILLIKPQLKT